jgi:hypothetical protein
MKATAHRLCVGAIVVLAASCSIALADDPSPTPQLVPVGGANSPRPSPPPPLVLATTELSAGSFTVKVPTGSFAAPSGGAATYSVPGPIISFRGPDGVWRGHGYLETYPRLLSFEGKADATSASLVYTFEREKRYEVKLTAKDGVVILEEISDLGPRNVFVFDAYYDHWLPSSGFALSNDGKHHAFLYLPCYYDKPEVTINPSTPAAGAVAVLSEEPAKTDIAGFVALGMNQWKDGDTMGIQLWQRRQLPGDPSSRHFLGPETKSDSTPNPHTVPLMGQSLYEGHVTIELNLGTGTRRLAFIVTSKGPTRETVIDGFKKIAEAQR